MGQPIDYSQTRHLMRHLVGKSAQGSFAGKSQENETSSKYFGAVANDFKFRRINTLQQKDLNGYLDAFKRFVVERFKDGAPVQIYNFITKLKEIHQASEFAVVYEKMKAVYDTYITDVNNSFSQTDEVKKLIYIVFMEKVEPIRHEFLPRWRNEKFENLSSVLTEFFEKNDTELEKTIKKTDEGVERSERETEALRKSNPAAAFLLDSKMHERQEQNKLPEPTPVESIADTPVNNEDNNLLDDIKTFLISIDCNDNDVEVLKNKNDLMEFIKRISLANAEKLIANSSFISLIGNEETNKINTYIQQAKNFFTKNTNPYGDLCKVLEEDYKKLKDHTKFKNNPQYTELKTKVERLNERINTICRTEESSKSIDNYLQKKEELTVGWCSIFDTWFKLFAGIKDIDAPTNQILQAISRQFKAQDIGVTDRRALNRRVEQLLSDTFKPTTSKVESTLEQAKEAQLKNLSQLREELKTSFDKQIRDCVTHLNLCYQELVQIESIADGRLDEVQIVNGVLELLTNFFNNTVAENDFLTSAEKLLTNKPQKVLSDEEVAKVTTTADSIQSREDNNNPSNDLFCTTIRNVRVNIRAQISKITELKKQYDDIVKDIDQLNNPKNVVAGISVENLLKNVKGLFEEEAKLVAGGVVTLDNSKPQKSKEDAKLVAGGVVTLDNSKPQKSEEDALTLLNLMFIRASLIDELSRDQDEIKKKLSQVDKEDDVALAVMSTIQLADKADKRSDKLSNLTKENAELSKELRGEFTDKELEEFGTELDDMSKRASMVVEENSVMLQFVMDPPVSENEDVPTEQYHNSGANIGKVIAEREQAQDQTKVTKMVTICARNILKKYADKAFAIQSVLLTSSQIDELDKLSEETYKTFQAVLSRTDSDSLAREKFKTELDWFRNRARYKIRDHIEKNQNQLNNIHVVKTWADIHYMRAAITNIYTKAYETLPYVENEKLQSNPTVKKTNICTTQVSRNVSVNNTVKPDTCSSPAEQRLPSVVSKQLDEIQAAKTTRMLFEEVAKDREEKKAAQPQLPKANFPEDLMFGYTILTQGYTNIQSYIPEGNNVLASGADLDNPSPIGEFVVAVAHAVCFDEKVKTNEKLVAQKKAEQTITGEERFKNWSQSRRAFNFSNIFKEIFTRQVKEKSPIDSNITLFSLDKMPENPGNGLYRVKGVFDTSYYQVIDGTKIELTRDFKKIPKSKFGELFGCKSSDISCLNQGFTRPLCKSAAEIEARTAIAANWRNERLAFSDNIIDPFKKTGKTGESEIDLLHLAARGCSEDQAKATVANLENIQKTSANRASSALPVVGMAAANNILTIQSVRST